MSSIDKGVEIEARKYNPAIKISRVNGQVVGTLNGNQIFSIKDRVGYINDTEKGIIQNAMRMYDLQAQERARQEKIRLENERKASLARARKSVSDAKSRLAVSFSRAIEACKKFAKDTGLEQNLRAFEGYSADGYRQRVTSVKLKIENNIKTLEREYLQRKEELERIERSIVETQSTAQSLSKISQVERVRTDFNSVVLPAKEIKALKEEMQSVGELLKKVSSIKINLEKVGTQGELGIIATNALSQIRQTKITCAQDVENLTVSIQDTLAQIDAISFRAESREILEQISMLRGAQKACVDIMINVNSFRQQDYTANDYRQEILQVVNRIRAEYSKLESADFTTCDSSEIQEVYERLQQVIIGGDSDQVTLDELSAILTKAQSHSIEDARHKDDYLDYKKKVDELLERGASVEDIRAFDVNNYEKQKRELNLMLIKQDLEISASASKLTFVSVISAMDEMGYKLFEQDWGLNEQGKNLNAEQKQSVGLACEGIFVIPGCKDVVMQVVATDNQIVRRLVAVRMSNGTQASPERVLEVARVIEQDGEMVKFLQSFAEKEGREINITDAVDTDTENCTEIIQGMGCYNLSQKDEREFEQIVGLGSEQDFKKWATKLSNKPVSVKSGVSKADTSSFVEQVREEKRLAVMAR